MPEIEDFVRRLPKAELHLHLEGAILPSTLVELSTRHDARPLTLPEAEALYQFTDFTGFLNAFKAVTARLIGPEDYELAARRMMEHLAAQGVVHAEVYIAVGVIYHWRDHDPAAFEPIFAALERARQRAERELGLSVFGFLMLCATSPSRRPRASSARPPNLSPLTPPSSELAWAATSAAPAPSHFRDFTPKQKRLVCASPTTPAKPLVPRPFGRPSPSVRSASATPSPPSRMKNSSRS